MDPSGDSKRRIESDSCLTRITCWAELRYSLGTISWGDSGVVGEFNQSGPDILPDGDNADPHELLDSR